ncbi:MAG: hypothetical protein LBI14_07400 [Treponema sp.]|jgi:hypothetical protein|nr:hypothetical protein [Treponema sp.]
MRQLFLALLFCASLIHAEEILYPDTRYLSPHTVYVGDKGRLIAELGPAFAQAEAFVKDAASEFPKIQNLVITRMELEKRNNNIRFIVDFVSYAPGVFVLPPLALEAPGNETLFLGGLEINIASILTPDQTAISLPALPLAFPGTGLLVYGTLGLILLVLILGIAGFIFAHKFLEPLRIKRRRRKLLASIEYTTTQLKKIFDGSENNDNDVARELFSFLAGEFREFLTFMTGIDCRVLSPTEFNTISLERVAVSSSGLSTLFSRWDRLRFSGIGMARNDVLAILDELGTFITNITSGEKHERGV